MLVLTRKSTEKIRIGENITLTVLRIKGKTVRIGIDAPDSIEIKRGELLQDEPSEILNEQALPKNSRMPKISGEVDSAKVAVEDPAITTLKIRRDEAPSVSKPETYPRLAAIVKKLSEKNSGLV